MDRYQRVEKFREDVIPINDNEIRVTAQGRMRNYISYAATLLQNKGLPEIYIKAMGRAINKGVMIAEIVKRRIDGLHQNTSITSMDIVDTWEPLEEGLLPVNTKRQVSMITITLSKVGLDASTIGYQSPLPSDQVKQFVDFDSEGEGGEVLPQASVRGHRGRGRGIDRPSSGRGIGAGRYGGDQRFMEDDYAGHAMDGRYGGRGMRGGHGGHGMRGGENGRGNGRAQKRGKGRQGVA